MKTQIEALKLALEALENLMNQHYAEQTTSNDLEKAERAITAIKEALAQPDQDEVDIRSRLYQRIHELETQLAQPEQEPVAWLSDDERKAFQRFYETWDDGEGYDVPKPMMKRLAQIGVIHHLSRGLYDITKFGHSLLGYATSSHPPVPTAQPKEPEQEPVKLVSYNCKCGRTMNFESVHGVVAPQRKPLIRDDIIQMAKQAGFQEPEDITSVGDFRCSPDLAYLVALVEAAHGIKE